MKDDTFISSALSASFLTFTHFVSVLCSWFSFLLFILILFCALLLKHYALFYRSFEQAIHSLWSNTLCARTRIYPPCVVSILTVAYAYTRTLFKKKEKESVLMCECMLKTSIQFVNSHFHFVSFFSLSPFILFVLVVLLPLLFKSVFLILLSVCLYLL